MGGAHRPSPVGLRRSVHRPRRSRDRLRRLSGHTGTDRVLGGGTGWLGHGTDGRVRTGQAELVGVTAGRRGQEIGQLLIERVVSGAASRGYEYLAVRRSAARNISTIREFYDAGFRTRPGFPAPTRRPAPAGRGRQALIDETAPKWMFCEFRALSSHCEGHPRGIGDSLTAHRGTTWLVAGSVGKAVPPMVTKQPAARLSTGCSSSVAVLVRRAVLAE